jgi:hypothetical protein
LAAEVLNVLLNVLELQVWLISGREGRRGECQEIPEALAGETEKPDSLFQRIPRDGEEPWAALWYGLYGMLGNVREWVADSYVDKRSSCEAVPFLSQREIGAFRIDCGRLWIDATATWASIAPLIDNAERSRPPDLNRNLYLRSSRTVLPEAVRVAGYSEVTTVPNSDGQQPYQSTCGRR